MAVYQRNYALFAERCEKAADLIERTGWTQRTLARNEANKVLEDVPSGSELVCFCALGAVSYCEAPKSERGFPLSRNNSFNEMHLLSYLSDELVALFKKDGLKFTSVGDYNDHPDRTKEEVVAMLRGAATRFKEQAQCPAAPPKSPRS